MPSQTMTTVCKASTLKPIKVPPCRRVNFKNIIRGYQWDHTWQCSEIPLLCVHFFLRTMYSCRRSRLVSSQECTFFLCYYLSGTENTTNPQMNKGQQSHWIRDQAKDQHSCHYKPQKRDTGNQRVGETLEKNCRVKWQKRGRKQNTHSRAFALNPAGMSSIPINLHGPCSMTGVTL